MMDSFRQSYLNKITVYLVITLLSGSLMIFGILNTYVFSIDAVEGTKFSDTNHVSFNLNFAPGEYYLILDNKGIFGTSRDYIVNVRGGVEFVPGTNFTHKEILFKIGGSIDEDDYQKKHFEINETGTLSVDLSSGGFDPKGGYDNRKFSTGIITSDNINEIDNFVFWKSIMVYSFIIVIFSGVLYGRKRRSINRSIENN